MRPPAIRMFGASCLFAVLFVLVAQAQGDEPSPQDRAYFESKIRPIFVARCYECHSAQAKTLRGKLYLDSKPGWQKGGDIGPAIEPGRPDESLIVQAIRYDDPALQMPPKGKLTDAEIDALTDWVKRGAPDPRTEPTSPAVKPPRVIDIEAGRKHWAFQPLKEVEPPHVKNEQWCRTPIDRFILARLESQGLAPAPEADRRVLIRRAYFDLIGLPPGPDDVTTFQCDDSADAFERLIDRLLASEHHGERWARHWLDLARFAESHGFEHDYDRPSAYHYRDFLIEAINSDLPYDTFVKWQLAGDEFEPDLPLALKATGFLAAGTHSTQITKNQVEKERYDEMDDMINTTGTAFLGLTIGCARCHDHKFDPIPARDYYRMLASFTTTVRSEIDLVPDPEAYRKARDKYEKEHQPYVDSLARFERAELPERLGSWEQTRDQTTERKPRWVVLEPSKIESKGGAQAKKQGDGSMLFEGPNAEFDTYTITAACDLSEITAIKLEALADVSLPHGGPGRAANGNFALSDLKIAAGPRYGIGATHDVRLANPKASFEQAGLPVAAVIDNDAKSSWAVDPEFGKDHAAVFEIGSNLRTDSGCTLTFVLDFRNNTGHNIGRLRLSATDAARPVGIDDDGIPNAVRLILALPSSERTSEQRASLLAWYKTIDMAWRALNQEVEDHAKSAPKQQGVKALICSEGLPPLRLHSQGDDFLPQTHFLRRGDPNQKEDEVTQGFLQVLVTAVDAEKHWQQTPPAGWRGSYRRRALAEWITDPRDGAGHLLARVVVNRLWQYHFGRGLVATPSDFGAQGSTPSHPELLDWLANQLIQNGWHLKPVHKLIMASAVYRQGSALSAHNASLDSENTLLWRQNARRLEAEPLRDAMLSISGLLDARMFGPGSLDERSRRRSIYFTIKRSKLIPMMMLFDAPDALVPIATRSTTTVAPQALFLLNSPVVREWAAAFAARVGPADGEAIDAAIQRAYRFALGRDPRPDELRAARSFLRKEIGSRGRPGDDQARVEAWTDFCQVLFATSEFLFIE